MVGDEGGGVVAPRYIVHPKLQKALCSAGRR